MTKEISDSLVMQLVEEKYGLLEWAAARVARAELGHTPTGAQVDRLATWMRSMAAQDPNWRPRA